MEGFGLGIHHFFDFLHLLFRGVPSASVHIIGLRALLEMMFCRGMIQSNSMNRFDRDAVSIVFCALSAQTFEMSFLVTVGTRPTNNFRHTSSMSGMGIWMFLILFDIFFVNPFFVFDAYFQNKHGSPRILIVYQRFAHFSGEGRFMAQVLIPPRR